MPVHEPSPSPEGGQRAVERDLLRPRVMAKGREWASLAEEVSHAYSDVRQIVEVAPRARIVLKMAQWQPLGVIKR